MTVTAEQWKNVEKILGENPYEVYHEQERIQCCKQLVLDLIEQQVTADFWIAWAKEVNPREGQAIGIFAK